MKKILTILTLMLFSNMNFSFATVNSIQVSTPAVSTTDQKTAKKDSFKTLLEKIKKKDLSDRQVTAALLAFFLGTFGAHNFYLGRKKQAIAQLLLSILGFILYISGYIGLINSVELVIPITLILGAFILLGLNIWVIVEFVQILTGKIV